MEYQIHIPLFNDPIYIALLPNKKIICVNGSRIVIIG